MSCHCAIKLLGSALLLCIAASPSSILVADESAQEATHDTVAASAEPRVRIAVAQFVNNTGGLEAQMQRSAVQMQAQTADLTRQAMELQQKLIPYMAAHMTWQTKVQQLGLEQAGPPPEAPELTPTASPYMTSVSDPVAGGLRDMMIQALLDSDRFVVLERAEIGTINWEQEFSRSGRVGEQTAIPAGEIEGAELLLIGSVNTLEMDQSGGSIGALLSTTDMAQSQLGDSRVDSASQADLSWKRAMVSMDIRLVDTRTSRVVATTNVLGKATGVGFKASQTRYTWNAGELPTGLSLYRNTPVEKAFRKMVDKAVQFLIDETPTSLPTQAKTRVP